ncbi:MAG: hypothetical protein J1E38_02170 [Paramuribaculum sp.]|nr:hypothetical protein [Paramuribaculum sp.]
MAKVKSLYSKQKYAEAFPYLGEATIRGDKDAQRYMGEYYRPGVLQH